MKCWLCRQNDSLVQLNTSKSRMTYFEYHTENPLHTNRTLLSLSFYLFASASLSCPLLRRLMPFYELVSCSNAVELICKLNITRDTQRLPIFKYIRFFLHTNTQFQCKTLFFGLNIKRGEESKKDSSSTDLAELYEEKRHK